MYYLIYKTTCLVNGKIYIGAHSTSTLNDGYLGSGTALKRAISKYGKNNFIREILNICENELEMFTLESQIVNIDFVKENSNYNIFPGGFLGFTSKNTIPVIGIDGKCFRISKDDPRYLSGEFKHNRKNWISVKDKNGNSLSVTKNDPRYLSGEVTSIVKGKVLIFDLISKSYKMIYSKDFNRSIHQYSSAHLKETGQCLDRGQKIVAAKRLNNGYKTEKCKDNLKKMHENNKGKINVKDKDGNIFKVSTTDDRINDTLFYLNSGIPISECHKRKLEKFEYILKSPSGDIIKTRRMKEFARNQNWSCGFFKVGLKRYGWELLEKIPL